MDYRKRVAADLDRWIADGLVDPARRGAILATLPARRTVDAVTALIWIAAVLLGLAVIAFIAANWEAIGRPLRFGLLLVAFLGAAGGGAEALRRGRTVVADLALTVAALVFASAIGLTGQIFDITGNPPAVPYGAGAAALALGVVGASRGALSVGVVAVLIGDLMTVHGPLPIPASLIVAPVALLLAQRWRSAFLAHVASLAVLGTAIWFAVHYDLTGWAHLGIAAVLAAAATVPRFAPGLLGEHAAGRNQIPGLDRIPLSWFVIGALGFFISTGYSGDFDGNTALGLAHRIAWIAVSAALIAYGRFDRQEVLTAVGVVSLIAASCALLYDLGLDLLVISLVFLACSVVALIVGLALRRGRGGTITTATESAR